MRKYVVPELEMILIDSVILTSGEGDTFDGPPI